MRISNIRHPEYNELFDDFKKWRLTYKGGSLFRNMYLQQFSKRETPEDFTIRKAISHVPAFAKAGINKIVKTFYSRMGEIVRIGGPDSYKIAVLGKEGGVDRFGSSMDVFLSESVTDELLTMKKVGIYVDRPPITDPLLSNNKGNKPYLYTYNAEDILSWEFGYEAGEYSFVNVLLRDHYYDYDPDTGLVTSCQEQYRHVFLNAEGTVTVRFYQQEENQDQVQYPQDRLVKEVTLPLRRIPFVVPGLKESLLADVADYQIGLCNISSADITYVWKANFPFYVEQYDPLSESTFTRRPILPTPGSLLSATPTVDPNEGMADRAKLSERAKELTVGAMHGRQYPKGADAPSFIAPPTEPLMASMAKQDQMKNQISELLDIAIAAASGTNTAPNPNLEGIESGLANIGLELQWAENEIAKIWAMYEKSQPAEVKYPSKYTLKSDSERLDEAKALNEVKGSAPSKTFAKEVCKQIANRMLSEKISSDTLDKIYTEIDAAEFNTSDPKVIQIAYDSGMVDAVTGSNALGFNGEKVVPIAQEEHAKRLALIASSQAQGGLNGNPAARGVNDINPGKVTAPADKSNPLDQNINPQGRGNAN